MNHDAFSLRDANFDVREKQSNDERNQESRKEGARKKGSPGKEEKVTSYSR
jgi:hypothetical protein